MTPQHLLRLFFCTTFAALAGCSTVDDTIDCAQVCSAYSDCFDSDYDVSTCTSECEEKADNDSNFENVLEACEDCIEDQSCAEATFACGAPCSNIVP